MIALCSDSDISPMPFYNTVKKCEIWPKFGIRGAIVSTRSNITKIWNSRWKRWWVAYLFYTYRLRSGTAPKLYQTWHEFDISPLL